MRDLPAESAASGSAGLTGATAPSRDDGPGAPSGGRSCTVRSVFDFAASNPASGRRSQGIATIEPAADFAGDLPVITAESSLGHGRAPAGISGRGRYRMSDLSDVKAPAGEDESRSSA